MAKFQWPTWRADVTLLGGGAAFGLAAGAAMVGIKHLNKHVMDKAESAPADYVTLYDGNKDLNKHFRVLRKFAKTKDEKDFLATLRHRLSRLIKLAYNTDDRLHDTKFWRRLGEIPIRTTEVRHLLDSFQLLVKERYDNQSMVGFDDAILFVRDVYEGIEYNNNMQHTDID